MRGGNTNEDRGERIEGEGQGRGRGADSLNVDIWDRGLGLNNNA